jgi:transcriptional regulator with PAS, ATPase and Fis domain
MVMCRPLIQENRVKGLIGFLGFSEDQRKAMIRHSSFLSELSERLNFIWETDGLDMYQFFRHPGAKAFIDLFESGLILTTPDYRILNFNRQAEHLLRAAGAELSGKRLSEILNPPSRKALRANLSSPSDLLGRNIRAGDYPLSGHRGIAGHVVVLSNRNQSRLGLKGCCLATPALSIIVGASPAMVRLREHASNVACGNSTVLIHGETGVGKELVARYIHQASRRWSGPFETVNCAAIPDSLFESEFFGYVPGAFTGAAIKGRIGRFEAADGGTILLDEISRLSLSNQAKILRVLEDGLVQRVGDERRKQVDVRVLAATNSDLEKAVAENRFLPDLYYRLAVIPLYVPPLRDRAEDIPLLLEYYLDQFAESLPDNDFRGMSPETLDCLSQYHWPGNVRELKNLVEYVMNVVRGREVFPDDLPERFPRPGSLAKPEGRSDLPLPLEEVENHQIRLALQTFGAGTQGKRRAARHLGISLSTLYRRLGKAPT